MTIHTYAIPYDIEIDTECSTIPLPKIVYCKDCKFQYTEECHCSYDDSTEWDDDGYIEMDFNTVYLMGNNDYCSYGKKR